MNEIIEMGSDSVIGYRIDGRINVEDINKISGIIEDKINRNYKLRVYVEVIKLGGISLEALVNDIKLAFKHYSVFEKKQ